MKHIFTSLLLAIFSLISFEAKADTIPLNFTATTDISLAFNHNALLLARYIDQDFAVNDSVYVNIFDDLDNLVFNSLIVVTAISQPHFNDAPSSDFTSKGFTGLFRTITNQGKSGVSFSISSLNYPGISFELFFKRNATVYKLKIAYGSALVTSIDHISKSSLTQNIIVHDFSGIEIYKGTLEEFNSLSFHGLFVVQPQEGAAYKICRQ